MHNRSRIGAWLGKMKTTRRLLAAASLAVGVMVASISLSGQAGATTAESFYPYYQLGANVTVVVDGSNFPAGTTAHVWVLNDTASEWVAIGVPVQVQPAFMTVWTCSPVWPHYCHWTIQPNPAAGTFAFSAVDHAVPGNYQVCWQTYEIWTQDNAGSWLHAQWLPCAQ